MRITDSAIINDFLGSINRSKNRINRLNMQVSSGKKLQKVSDDPITASSILHVSEQLDKIAQYRSNVVDGKGMLKATADSLGAVSDLIGEVKKILTGAVSSGDDSLLGKLANQVELMQGTGLEIANDTYGSKYIFGGTKTRDVPFVRIGNPPQVTYQGNAQSIQCQVGDGVTQTVNVSGAAAFSSTGFIDLGGDLDRNAAINTVVSQTVQITDANGAGHNVTMRMRKMDNNTWSISAAMPPGSTDANLSGGTATVTFDPVTGDMKDIVRGSALILSPTGATPGQTAPPINLLYTAGGLTEVTGGGGSSIAGVQRNVSLWNKLAEISTNLRSGVKPTADDMAILNTMQDVVMREEAKAGASSASLTTADDFLKMQNTHLMDLFQAQSEVTTDDLPEIAMRLKQEQTMLDAALGAAAKLIPKSLVDFLT